MSDDAKKGEAPKEKTSGVTSADLPQPDRKPKTVRRAPADKMLRPGMTRGYETK